MKVLFIQNPDRDIPTLIQGLFCLIKHHPDHKELAMPLVHQLRAEIGLIPMTDLQIEEMLYYSGW